MSVGIRSGVRGKVVRNEVGCRMQDDVLLCVLCFFRWSPEIFEKKDRARSIVLVK